MKQYVPVAERYDFTQDGEPPWQIMKEIDNDSRLLKRIRRVVQEAVRQAQPDNLSALEADASPSGDRVQPADSTSLASAQKAVPQTVERNVETEDFSEPTLVGVLDAEDFDF